MEEKSECEALRGVAGWREGGWSQEVGHRAEHPGLCLPDLQCIALLDVSPSQVALSVRQLVEHAVQMQAKIASEMEGLTRAGKTSTLQVGLSTLALSVLHSTTSTLRSAVHCTGCYPPLHALPYVDHHLITCPPLLNVTSVTDHC